ncbi:site-specific DNA-methyltransferase [Brevundimonas viscosa]|uniref:site-specific DNA-methyltransferase (adenine-specific) n=1 Tax=Brevundimonas viscosa TaxID=871741 RepID=A0A1I6T7P6_9CAUL|nr:site-specific DNA-methyltransferase [Brevundimonas viscosa]SFS85108.1 adenine-specific DNA-methyltransferase [Brevundimonas viscosa]
MARTPKGPKQVTTLTHDEATRKNIPTAELQSTAQYIEEMNPSQPVAYPRARSLAEGERRERDEDLDPQIIWNGVRIRLTEAQVRQLHHAGEVEIGDAQLVWRGKDTQDWSDLIVQTPPLYIQEKIHPRAIIDDLRRRSEQAKGDKAPAETIDLFADFNGVDPEAKTEFYQHDQHWSNRMILGDSLQVMASLAERERLAGKVQCIYFDPPYGIKFNSNWQVSTQSRDVKDGKQTDISREPEQVKAFRDTWKDGIHSYLTYLRDRLTVMRELLTDSGSIFVQIGDENVHRVRAVMDEVFGPQNFVSQIAYQTTTGRANATLAAASNYLLWAARNIDRMKFREPLRPKSAGSSTDQVYRLVRRPDGSAYRLDSSQRLEDVSDGRLFAADNITSSRYAGEGDLKHYWYQGQQFPSGKGTFKTDLQGLNRLAKADRIWRSSNSIRYVRYLDDFNAIPFSNVWTDTQTGSFTEDKVYVVQTAQKVVERCILMATDPGDLVVDPTCGSGTTAYVAEQWGRRWITIDTSRVALALARTRLMSARYPYYLLADSPEGRKKEQEVSGQAQPLSNAQGDIRQGFVYDRVPRVQLGSIARNAEIDVIWEEWQAKLEPLREALNARTGRGWEEWEIPREVQAGWDDETLDLHRRWWDARIARQKEIDASIAKRADVELLYDRPYVDSTKVRVAGPFTVESLSPHRVAPSDVDALYDEIEADEGRRKRLLASAPPTDFAEVVLENLRTSGVQQGAKADRIEFTSLTPWPGQWIAAEGRYVEGDAERRAAIFIGPEFGTASRPDLTAAAREATEARFDVLIACAFNFEAHASELTRMGPLPILKAKINPDLHMAGELKNTGKGNLFIVFGEPDVEIETLAGGQLQVRVLGVDVFDPNTGDVRSGDTKSIAAWFIDTDYDEESFFVRHAYFLGANDPYKSLKTALRAEIDEGAWATLYRDVSRPFDRPRSGRIAVKVINHFGDEVMKVFRV